MKTSCFRSRLKKLKCDIDKIQEEAPSKATDTPVIVVCVLLRSSITKKVLSIWQQKLPSLDPRITCVISQFYDPSVPFSRPPLIGSRSSGSATDRPYSNRSSSSSSCRGTGSSSSTSSTSSFLPSSSSSSWVPSGVEPTVAYIIMPTDIDKEKFYKWVGHDCSTSLKQECAYYYLTPEWAYAVIKSGSDSCDKDEILGKHLHPLHNSLPWAELHSVQHSIPCTGGRTDSGSGVKSAASTTNDFESYYNRRKAARELDNESEDQDSECLDNVPALSPQPPPKQRGKFACMIDSNPELNPTRPGVAQPVVAPKKTNLNSHITDIFKELHKIYEMNGDQWRARSYKVACTVLEQLPFRVTDSEQLRAIRGKHGKKGLGNSVLTKIQEIITTGTLGKLSGLQRQNPDIQSRLEFNKIWGVGPSTAQSLVDQGFKSIADLRAAMRSFLPPHQLKEEDDAKVMESDIVIDESQKDLSSLLPSAPTLPPRCPLTVQQMIGLNRFEDLLERMDRDEVRDIEETVKAAVRQIDPGASCVVCGSYRRGKPSSGDVDILIYPDDGREHIDILPELLNSLTQAGFLTDHLTVPHTFQGFYPPLPVCPSFQPYGESTAATVSTTVTNVEDEYLSDCEHRNPVWLSDENLNASESESDDGDDNLKNKNMTENDFDEPPTKIGKPNNVPAGRLVRASSLTSNAVYSYDASQVLESLNSQGVELENSKRPPPIQSADKGVKLTTKIDALSRTLDPVNERKRQRQIQLQKHSVVFNRSNSGPTASYMGVCRLHYDENSTGTRREYRHRRIDLKSYPRSYVPFALLYFTGSAHFNRSMRLFCRQKNMTLSDKVSLNHVNASLPSIFYQNFIGLILAIYLALH